MADNSRFWQSVMQILPVFRPRQRQPVHQVDRQQQDRIPEMDYGPASATVYMQRIIRGGRSQTLLRMRYNGQDRMVEPYSFRDKSTGRLFYAFCLLPGHGWESFRIDRIEALGNTQLVFTPRAPIEL